LEGINTNPLHDLTLHSIDSELALSLNYIVDFSLFQTFGTLVKTHHASTKIEADEPDQHYISEDDDMSLIRCD